MMLNRAFLSALALCAVPCAAIAQPASELRIAGTISSELTYRLRVDYLTTADDDACRVDDFITGMRIAQTQSEAFAPVIEGATHHVAAPLAPSGGPGACGWSARAAFVCIGLRDAPETAQDCKPLLVVRSAGLPLQPEVHLTCDPRSLACTSPNGRYFVQQIDSLAASIRLDVSAGPIEVGPAPG